MTKPTPHTADELLQQVAAGNEKAFKILFDTYRNRLYYYLLGITKSGTVAEDLVMEVFMKIWLGKDLAGRINNFDAFLFRIAHNKAVDFLKSAARDRHLQTLLLKNMQPSGAAEADQLLLVQEFEAKLREAINLLPHKRREVYLLSREEGLSHDEIAERLSITPKTVSNQITQSQKFIREHLADHLDLAILILLLAHYTAEVN